MRCLRNLKTEQIYVNLENIVIPSSVNDKDINALKRFLAGWNIAVVESLLDINGDGVVDDKDANYLARSLAGWTGYEL